MKKVFTLLVLCFTMFSFTAFSQIAGCNAEFSVQYLAAGNVKFTPVDLAGSPTTTHSWVFSYNLYSSAISPTQSFSNGSYTVTHTISKQNPNGVNTCSATSTQQINVTNGTCTLAANFSITHHSSIALKNYYNNSSLYFTAGDSIKWTFGDGAVSYDQNPTHTYTTPGIYTTCLRVKKQANSATTTPCVSEICKLDTAVGPTNPCNIQAYFTIDSTNSNVFHFNNISPGFTSGDSIRWTFGDGTSSNSINPTHTYTVAGTYTVCLRIIKYSSSSSTPCVSEYCKTVNVTIPCNLVAGFTFYRDSSATIANNTYHFTNTTVPSSTTDSIRWTFGDGTSSNQANPVHVYAQGGTYTACLRVIKRVNGALTNCVSEICHVVTVPITNPCNLQVYFSNHTDSAQSNLVHFLNQSYGYASGDSITWTFGDGTTSHDVNPNHIFTAAGVYTVCLRIKKNNSTAGTVACVREYCKTITIVVPCTLVANFTSYRDSAALNLYTYHFTNTSTPLSTTDSVRWTFGDGTSSNQINATHGYAQPGNYTVCLRVIKRNANGTLTTCVAEKCNILTITQVCNLISSYTWAATTANYKTINFTNTTAVGSTNITALWSFGDGTTATSYNASHTYTNAGRYYVCLRIQYGNCVNYKCDSITVVEPVPACTQLSNYTFAATTPNNNTIAFTPNYISNSIQYTWSFGDGTGAQTANATHQYTAVGYYTVCLTAFRNNSCASTTCKTVYISSVTNCGIIGVDFNVVRDTMVPNRVTFVALANTTITDQIWTITKVPTTGTTGTVSIHANNPTYVFLDSGVYRVCLRAAFAGGCVKEYCKTIHIAQQITTATTCTLQVFPNPATNVANAVVTLTQPLTLYAFIYNSMNVQVGQKQQLGVVGTNTVSINIEALPAGIYGYKVIYGNQVCSATFVK